MPKELLLKDFDEIKEYLDLVIKRWRQQRDEENCEYAKYYIDAFQSVRLSIFGSLLGEE